MNYSVSGVGGRSADGRHPGTPSRKKGPKKPARGQREVVKLGEVKGEAIGLTEVLERMEYDIRDNVFEWVLLGTFKLNPTDLKRALVNPEAKRRLVFDMVSGEAYWDVYRQDTFTFRDLPRLEAKRLGLTLIETKRHTSGRPLTDAEKKRMEQNVQSIISLLFGPTVTHLWECSLRDTGIGGYKAMASVNADTGVAAVMVRWNDLA